MNERAAQALYAAEAAGVKQIKGALRDGHGGRCAMGVLADAKLDDELIFMMAGDGFRTCGLCGKQNNYAPGGYGWAFTTLGQLISHMNDDHGLTFSEIARKLGPDTV